MTKQKAREIARKHWAAFLHEPLAVRQTLQNLKEFSHNRFARCICFAPGPNEIDVLSVLEWPVYLPRTLSAFEMEFRRADGLSDLVPGRYGIREPGQNCALFALPFTPEDLLVVPALAVNRERFRLGKGGGYYDRMKVHFEQAVVAAVLPEILLELDFPGEDHDLKVNAVITEAGVR